MSEAQIISNPFSQMIDLGAVLSAVQNSERLSGLKSRIFRPLSKPVVVSDDADVVAFDEALDSLDEAVG